MWLISMFFFGRYNEVYSSWDFEAQKWENMIFKMIIGRIMVLNIDEIWGHFTSEKIGGMGYTL